MGHVPFICEDYQGGIQNNLVSVLCLSVAYVGPIWWSKSKMLLGMESVQVQWAIYCAKPKPKPKHRPYMSLIDVIGLRPSLTNPMREAQTWREASNFPTPLNKKRWNWKERWRRDLGRDILVLSTWLGWFEICLSAKKKRSIEICPSVFAVAWAIAPRYR